MDLRPSKYGTGDHHRPSELFPTPFPRRMQMLSTSVSASKGHRLSKLFKHSLDLLAELHLQCTACTDSTSSAQHRLPPVHSRWWVESGRKLAGVRECGSADHVVKTATRRCSSGGSHHSSSRRGLSGCRHRETSMPSLPLKVIHSCAASVGWGAISCAIAGGGPATARHELVWARSQHDPND